MEQKKNISQKVNNIGLSLKIGEIATEDNILKIIDFLSRVEMEAQNTIMGAVKYKYTHGACFDLALLIKSIYEFNQGVQIVRLHPNPPEIMSKSAIVIIRHYVVEFDGCYYDINGKHSKREMKANCKRTFKWRGVEFSPLTNSQTTTFLHNFHANSSELIQYCSEHIVKQKDKVNTFTTQPLGI